ncbi:MAG: CapA family protein [Streptococcaceae bacterium]|jgi:poly-gamma-glutamate synthesis protein (capsule biosynthesis protein)|nr:CapA family protein [Streptococcaceae bacterium]
MVDNGADLVLCQHTHCIGTWEDYQNGKILYGQGNFLWNNSQKSNDFVGTGLLIALNVSDEITVKSYVVKRTETGTSLATEEEAKMVVNEMSSRYQEIKNSDFIEEEYQVFAQLSLAGYTSRLLNFVVVFAKIGSFVIRVLLKLGWLKTTRNPRLPAVLNSIKCESHRELLIKGIMYQENN